MIFWAIQTRFQLNEFQFFKFNFAIHYYMRKDTEIYRGNSVNLISLFPTHFPSF